MWLLVKNRTNLIKRDRIGFNKTMGRDHIGFKL